MIPVTVGSSEEFNAMAFGQKHPGTINFLQNQISNIQNMSNIFTDAGRMFVTAATDMFNRYNSEEALRRVSAAVRKVSHVFQSNTIRHIHDIGGLQQAPVIMQRYIMAEPTVRNMYLEQRCDGYSGTYVNMHGNAVGEDHYDYRRVMNGIVADHIEEDGETNWKCTLYYEELIEGDRELTIEEQDDVINTWDAIKYAMKLGEDDPTSADNLTL